MLYVYRFFTSLILATILTACGSDDSGGEAVNTTLTQDDLVGTWVVSNIVGIPDSVGGPSSVDASNSTFTFRSDGTYDWFFIFNRDPFFFNLSGTGNYSLNGTKLTFDGVVADTILGTLQTKVVTLTVSSDKNTFSFVDDENDRWSYSSSSSSSSSGGAGSVAPVTALTSSETIDIPGGLGQVTIESGSEGDIGFVNQIYQLSNGTPSINVVGVQRVEAADFTCSDGTNFNGAQSSDFSTGVLTLNAVVDDQNISCIANFQTILPVTISAEQSITNLLDEWGQDLDPANAAQSGLLNTTCPSSIDDGLDIDPFTLACDGSFLRNYTVADDHGGVHKLATKFSFTSSSSSSSSGGGFGTVTFTGDYTSRLPRSSFTPTSVVFDDGPLIEWTDGEVSVFVWADDTNPDWNPAHSVTVWSTPGSIDNNSISFTQQFLGPESFIIDGNTFTFRHVYLSDKYDFDLGNIYMDGTLNR